MDPNTIKPDLRVSVAKLGSTMGFMIKPHHLVCRRVGAMGTILSYVPGHGGDVWWVKHDGGDEVAAYCFDELEPLTS